ncbi:magnesium transporter [Geoalkalibacter ferrihydriticus]|uniref:Magnesium transporter MgtE n=2 Tax=Geoalkalibacter ferrihydriticus TaxID=392333 RepID=A0A0C2EE20_9BACT|nr:magnesium transporter [Geoalkalibacter ferrihydriticus]KIH76843.1 magnesium transporter [Geoalkalibacter ferrihydriticus DSM 17813]SDL48167.1 magnesium transporter [Geoalkalibacter ferrihydriticus]
MSQNPLPTSDLKTLRQELQERTPLEVADELARLAPAERAKAFRLLAKDSALEVFQLLDAAHQEELLGGLRDEQVLRLVEEMDADDRARLFDEMPATVVRKLQAGLSPRERRLTAMLLGYPDESAGRIMSPKFIRLIPEMRVEDALARVRRRAQDAEPIYTLPVTDDELRLLGTITLRDLLLAEPENTVGEIMSGKTHAVSVDEDQEQVARIIQGADLLAVPVVDSENRLVGMVTVDDAMDVLGAETGEDLARTGASEPLGRPYFSASVFHLARSRAVWLLMLAVAATLTVNVLSAFEQTLEEVVVLALFIPLLIGTGGNAGAQSATTVVRSMALDDIRPEDILRVVLREARVGFLLGGVLAALSLIPVWLFAGESLAVIIALSLITVCTLASFVGSMMPLLARKVGVDPAVVSAPFVTTIVDASGLLVYFLIARAVLGL